MKRVSYLIKIGRRRHLTQFRNGLVYMNCEEYFASLENDVVRSDHFEGTDCIAQPKDITSMTVINGDGHQALCLSGKNFVGPLRMNFGKRPHGSIYCLHELEFRHGKIVMDDKNKKFGDSFVMVMNTQKFINRLCRRMERFGYRNHFNSVRYYDHLNYTGDTGPFRKPRKFEYQREFRFICYSGRLSPLKIFVGNIMDITSKIIPLSQIKKIRVKFRP